MTELQILGGDLDHPEGVAWSTRFGLYAGGEAGQIYRVDVDTGHHDQIADTGGYVLGLAFGPDDRLYACDMARRAVVAVDVDTGEVDDVTSAGPVDLHVPNFPVFTATGTMFVSDSGQWGTPSGRIMRYTLDGQATVAATTPAWFPNGLAIDPTHEWLYVVESSAARIARLRIDAEDDLNGYEVAVELPGAVPDGLAFCEDGSLLIACYRPDAIYRWNQREGLHVLAEDPTGLSLSAPTNIVFAGTDREHLIAANLANRHLTKITGTGLTGAPLEFTDHA